MPSERLYLTLSVALIATSIGSSVAAVYFYQVGLGQPSQPKGSLSDDGSWRKELFSDDGSWDPGLVISRILSQNYTSSGVG